MKTNFKKLLSALLAALMILPTLLAIAVSAEEVVQENAAGATFASNVTYTTSLTLDETPVAFEATIKLPEGYNQRAGVIFGNYSSNGTPGISFELISKNSSCKPRLYCTAPNVTMDCTFDTGIETGKDVHIAINVTSDNKAVLYIDGVEKETKSINANYFTVLPTNKYMVGGDLRGGNAQYFKGEIKNVAVYSEVLTEAEIQASGVDYTSSKLLCAYDLTKSAIDERIQDLSPNGIDLIYSDPTYDQTELSKALTFTSNDTFKMCKTVSSSPLTFEAEVFLPTGVTNRGGIILGNYSQHTKSVNIEIYTGGSPRLYFETDNGALYDFTFNEVDIRGSWVNFAIVLDAPNGLVHCYVNGRLRQTIDHGEPIVIDNYEVYDSPLYLGRDTRSWDGRPFLGAIKSLALYGDIRTSDEILSDCSRVDLTNDDLVAAYYFTEESGRNDISGNAHHIYYDGEEVAAPDDGNEGEEGDDNTGSGITTLDGMTFESGKYAMIYSSFENSPPLTIEASVLIPSTQTDRAGVIVGNFNDNSNYFSFEIYSNGVPRFCLPSEKNGVIDFKFDKLHINTGEVVHIALTYNPTTGEATCYIDGGAQYQTIKAAAYSFSTEAFSTLLVMGNDLRKGSAQYFKGTIGSLAIYSDVRTSLEIESDFAGVDLNSDNLVVCYDLTGKAFGDEVENLAGDGYDIAYKSKAFADSSAWFSKENSVTDYLYSFAIVGDTQIIAQNYSSEFHKIYDWILNNKTDKNIQYVFGLGDITNGSSTNEWNVAKENIFRLIGQIPFSAVRGNHDTVSSYNNAFVNNSDYMSQFNGFYSENDARNTYRLITIAETNYLMITLDYGASDEVLSWASNIIESYPNHKVIITTHAYLYRDGTTLDQGDVCPPATNGGYNNGDHMWDKLISQHENICLVISGHDPSAQVVMSQQTGVHGNLVTQLLVDPQGVDTSTPTGMVTMLYVKTDGSFEIETYSTIQELYYKESNQFVISETKHNYTSETALTYENGYMQNGSLVCVCEICEYAHAFETAPIFTFSGYSVRENSTNAVCVGYSIDYQLLSKYEAFASTTITIGMVASPSDSLVNPGMPINNDGSIGELTSGKIINYVLENDYYYVDLILKSKDWNAYQDHNFILCAYVIENNSIGYICDTEEITSTALATSYSEIISSLS